MPPMDDFEEDEDLPPMPKKGKKLPPPPKKGKPVLSGDEDDEEDMSPMNDFEEDDDLPPMPKKGKKLPPPPKKGKPALSGDEEEAPARSRRRRRETVFSGLLTNTPFHGNRVVHGLEEFHALLVVLAHPTPHPASSPSL